MLFSLSSERKFDTELKRTPAAVGPGIYETTPVMGNHLRMKAPFGTRSSREIYPPPVDPPPPPGEYCPKPLPTNIAITHVFTSETKRPIFTGSQTPGPGQYGKLNDYRLSPPRELHPRLLPTAPLVTGYVGQDISGYGEDRRGEWRPVRLPRRGPEWIGPGTYAPTPVSMECAISLEKSAARPIFGRLPENPGPGAYSPSLPSDRLPIAISAVSRAESRDPGGPPLPGPQPPLPRAPDAGAVFRSREPRNPFPPVEPTPAPVAYFRPKRQRFEAGDGLGYRAERAFGVPAGDGPGPGAYEARARWIRGRGSALARAVGESRQAEAGPGPGAYEMRATWGGERTRTHSVFASRSAREAPEPEPLPAPGAYNPRITDATGRVPALIHEARFAKFGDWVDFSKLDLPPPDSYQRVRIMPGRGRSISTITREEKDKNQFPGPGQYEVLHAPIGTRSKNAKASQVKANGWV